MRRARVSAANSATTLSHSIPAAVPRRWLPDDRTFAAGPERASRTGLAFRIVDPFLMRAAQHFLDHRHRVHLMAPKTQGDFLKCRGIVADIAALGEPPPQRDRLGVRRDDDADGYLA